MRGIDVIAEMAGLVDVTVGVDRGRTIPVVDDVRSLRRCHERPPSTGGEYCSASRNCAATARFDSSVRARRRSAGSIAVGAILTARSSESGLPGAKTTPRLYART